MATANDEEATPPAKRRRTDDGTDVDSSEKETDRENKSDSAGQKPPYIDESLYSRQLYVLGRDAVVRMAQSDVLISGLGGLGVEVAKNIILAGVRSVTLHDEVVCTRVDLSSQVVVLTETSLAEQMSISLIARRNNVALIVADTRGLAGQIFCDFGDNFRVTDPNGEQALSVPIGSITKEQQGIVSCPEETRHGLEDGDYVTFSEVKGMNEINSSPPMKIKVLSPTEFSVGDTTQFSDYTSGGFATQVKMPNDIKFEDAETVVKLAKKLNTTMAAPVEAVDDELITKLSCVSAGSLCPMQAVIGSIAAQEVLKACSGKFNPIQQWFYFDAFECLPQDADVDESDANAMALKSVMAGQSIVELNQDINIAVGVDEVGPETNIISDDFFESLDGVAIAVDNAETRHYMDRCCVHYGKPLIDSGIMGTKGSVQVVVPHITENYSASQDPPEESVPADTIKYFPSNIEHILLWAREEFKVLFEQSAANADRYIRDPDFIPRVLEKLQLKEKVALLKEIKAILVDERASGFGDCVSFARLRFQEQYNDQIRQLLRSHPENQITTSGAPFWSGHKRCPHPIQFDPKNTLHMDYIVAAANLRAAMYGLAHNTDREEIADMLESVEVPALGPQNEGVQEAAIDANPPQTDVPQPDDDNALAKLLEELPHPKRLVDVPLSKMEFNTEDDKNFHVDFIVAAANLRASSYNIEPADQLKSKLIAAKIMPAIVTTASLVAGLASLELYKYNDQEFTVWDYLDVEGELTLREFLEYFQNNHKVNIVELSEGSRTLYATSLPSSASRLELSMSELVEAVSQQEIDPDKRFLVFDLKCRDVNGRDVELPRVRYELSRNEDDRDAKMADGREQE
ncbi:hypothetical protein HPB52_011008 [Rhipicephalus sanguineus]|uniref:Ubiquitin-activating enzyme E1 C-terminal domain-containing protein n=1 Tax=Rhipicephalus sanguineus TaxID=34632 RepID=A0A9D4T1U0_RHISA|nr:hypothetical protein HPB52_011008 [Rhipicephalus sanguineus]